MLFETVLISFSVRVLLSDCIITLNARDFFPNGILSPSYKSKIEISLINDKSTFFIKFINFNIYI